MRLDSVIERQKRYRVLIAGSHYVTWFLGRRFPDAVPLCFVTGFPKSGTTWVTQLMASVLGLPYPRQSLIPIGCAAVVHGHQVPDHRLRRGVYVLRDGRDVMVSLYHHLAADIPSGDNPPLTRQQRRWFPGLVNKACVRENLPGFLREQFKRPVASQGRNWAHHVLSYYQHPNTLALVRYEEMLEDAERALIAAVEKVTNEPANHDDIRTAIKRFAFQRQARSTYKRPIAHAFLRNGKAGSWRDSFTPEAAHVFNETCRDALRATGYEADDRWVDKIDDLQSAA